MSIYEFNDVIKDLLVKIKKSPKIDDAKLADMLKKLVKES